MPDSTQIASSVLPTPQSTPQPTLKREFGFLDLVLYYVVCGMSLRWIATAAESGPSSIVVWLFAWIAFFLPLAACVLELSSRYPQEGGLYVWAREGYGDFAGFIAAWSYWMSNLPYFATVLYFSASCALFAAGKHGAALANDSTYFMAFSLIALGLITFLNMRGVKLTKLLNTTGAIGMIVPIIVLIVLGVVSWFRSGSATHFTMTAMAPHGSIKNAIFWSTIFLAFGGVESASFMGGEIKEPRKTIPRALVFAGILITLGYVGGTIAMLVALPSEQISGLGGFMTAIEHMCHNLAPKSFASWTWVAIVVIALLVAISNLGNACAYLASCSRLPFVAGIDNYLPAAFGRVHPRWNTPYIAILVYGLGGMLFAFLGQAGTSVKGAYDVLVSMSIITFFIPYLFLFGTMIRVQNRPVSPDVIRVPGARRAAIPLAILGILTTLLTIALSVLPADDEPNKPLAVLKIIGLTIVMLGAGVIVYAQGKRRQAHRLAAISAEGGYTMSPDLAQILALYDDTKPLEEASTIPGPWYLNPAILALEEQQVFSNNWQCVGRLDQVTNPGDYFTTELANEPILITRDTNHTLRAFYNVCRHHAAAVATMPENASCGHAQSFRCPYHGWNYALDGSLKGAPEFTGVCNFDRERNGLVPIAIDTWENFLFINLNPSPKPLPNFLGDLVERVAPLNLTSLHFHSRKEYTLHCNWKVYVDNYLDGGYHVPHLHKALNSVLDYAHYTIESGQHYCLQSSPMVSSSDHADVSETRHGDRAWYYWLYPNFTLNIYEGVMDTNFVLPLGPNKCKVIFDFFFADIRPEQDAYNTASVATSDQVQDEDVAICESVQKGLASRAYGAGRLSVRREAGEHLFHRLLARDLKAANNSSGTLITLE